MTNDELLKAVLEHEGWTDLEYIDGKLHGCTPACKRAQVECPDYLNDRNAVAELVEKLGRGQLIGWGGLIVDNLKPTYDYESIVVSPVIQLRAYWEVVQ